MEQFCENGNEYKICIDSRIVNRIQNKNWKENNKEIISLYNKTYNQNKTENVKKTFIYAKKII